jgi:excisionase family DNA binding protein
MAGRHVREDSLMTTVPKPLGTSTDPRTEIVDNLLTPDEVAQRLRTSPRFVRRLVAERRIAFTKVGKFVRIAAGDVEAFVAAGRVESGGSYVRPIVRLGSAAGGTPER